MKDDSVTPKDIRNIFNFIRQAQKDLSEDAAKLNRLWYKSKAQHKRAKWFQTLDGIRKCLRRLLTSTFIDSFHNDEENANQVPFRTRYTSNVAVEGSLPDRKGRVQRKRSNVNEKEVTFGLLDKISLSLIDVWCSFWNEKRGDNTELPKYDRIPDHSPDVNALCTSLYHVLQIAIAMEHLTYRTSISFNILSSHLRTPPAPTFAPLVTICLTISAKIHAIANRLLCGDDESVTNADQPTKKESNKIYIIKSYSDLHHSILSHSQFKSISSNPSEKQEVIILNSRSVQHSTKQQTLLNRFQPGKEQEFFSYLPARITRQSQTTRDDVQNVQRQLITNEKNDHEEKRSAYLANDIEDEDIGEIV